jgi:hypothetical protein
MQHVICREKKADENGSGQKDEDGEIGSDREESKEKEKTRKRPREREPTKTLEQQYSEEPRTKKAALEQLKSMRFATKDPFKDNPLVYFICGLWHSTLTTVLIYYLI